VISLFHFCALIRFAICALSHSFFFYSLGFVLVIIFPCVILQRNKKQFPISFSSWFEDCIVASVARKEVYFA
jgi:hypothetical protein